MKNDERQDLMDFWRYMIRWRQNRDAVERDADVWLRAICRCNAEKRTILIMIPDLLDAIS